MYQIREARPDDISRLMEFQANMASETENIELDRAILRKGIEALLADTGKGKYFVAETAGQPVGCLMTTYEWSDWRNGTVLWIQSVYVAKPYRGKGIYKALYQHVQSMVERQPSLRGIRLYVDKRNQPAQQVYRQLGMDGEHYQVFEWMKQ